MNRDTSLHRKRRRAFALSIAFLSLLVFVSRYALAQAPGDIDSLDLNILGKVYATAVQPDGKIVIAGGFSSVLGFSRQNIARLNADGTLDLSFFPKTNLEIESVAVQTDGKVVLGGGFSGVQPSGQTGFVPRNRSARLYADGSLDMGFDPNVDGPIRCLAVQADGKVLLGGAFLTLQPNGSPFPVARQCVARVHSNGTLDSGFDPKANFNVYSVAVQTDGKVLLGGLFTTLQPNGETIGSQYNGSSGVVQAIGVVQPIPIEAWRMAHFGTSADSGFAANNADPDADGLCNLDEYALAGHPLRPANRPVPTFMSPAFLFSRNASATDISLRIETSATLGSGSWTPIATRIAGANGWTSEPGVSVLENDSGFVTITDNVAPGVVPQRFLRLEVTHP